MKKLIVPLALAACAAGCSSVQFRSPVQFSKTMAISPTGLPMTHHVTGCRSHLANHFDYRLKVECPCCGLVMITKPLALQAGNRRNSNGGSIVQRTATFLCENRHCQIIFTVPCEEIYVPNPTPAAEVEVGEAQPGPRWEKLNSPKR
jgi:hypothetical protein